jgi:hypothetical protein
VTGVEEARWAALRQRLAGDPRAYASHSVATVLEDLGDVTHLFRSVIAAADSLAAS